LEYRISYYKVRYSLITGHNY